MPNWDDSQAIKKALARKWENGHILRNALDKDDLFPCRIKLKGPSNQEMNMHFPDIVGWIKQLKSYDKNSLGYGYVLAEKKVHHELLGKNIIPCHAIIPTLADAVLLLGKKSCLGVFEQNAAALLQEWPCLKEWIRKKPFQIIEIGENIAAVLQVLRWFSQHEERYLYLRQLDIEGVDTKFIETHRQILGQLLDIVLPSSQINFNSTNFEQRYGLKSKPRLIRFRFLDEKLAPYGCTDISLPIGELQQINMPCKYIFIAENEINFLSFPPVANACIIFGGGYKVDDIQNLHWLHEREIYYWGDIDTHGLRMLGKVRSFFPQTKSFLMTKDILLGHRLLWSKENTPFLGEIANLTPQENELARNLQSGLWGQGVRLEQERISFSKVKDELASFA